MKDYVSKYTSLHFSFKAFVGGIGAKVYLEGIRFEGRLAVTCSLKYRRFMYVHGL